MNQWYARTIIDKQSYLTSNSRVLISNREEDTSDSIESSSTEMENLPGRSLSPDVEARNISSTKSNDINLDVSRYFFAFCPNIFPNTK